MPARIRLRCVPKPRPLPGERGTIPEQIPPLDAGSQQEMSISSDDIRRAQEALKGKGFDPGAIAAECMLRLQEALREFQKANDLQTTGDLAFQPPPTRQHRPTPSQ